ncbi:MULTISPECIES: hybrid sensor histidine kinase/response regulator [unclassified Polaromonas]|jgi:signal transduction histidine kinase|uniref:hybrid sensor histidine kinase/response regulator n=1 Tax=unclassified Polaromonas TaxID=2638319 RepID=UPI000BC7C5BC|nr:MULTISPECIES: hybrid sensor histidine kinase/response regulator [unclassified Polaromonas]OYY37978.1 MAG: hybrid sensor histidine kinase/response regulator [Polaromonas sp. 35-63-35]OYZ21159.1 MAG: hybrid sensor histidine kinase/response regulator [Polaromonas sp. 16-63-31]OYZ79524.1 MAG: hybrid sensor histidine kinase/response regulator [Polaromonas sp. 24-63-21]OZA50671.1 MAG: hybrid sensor histidine kinase/response regulator [Polaromonas sp. 17-63-33]OZA89529.1 MAG: hybrid sensor histidi
MRTPDVAKVLIVDDLPGNLLALNALIRRDGREIFQASSGEEALDLLLEHEFALAILDVQMPGMSGFELAELMRGTEKTRQIPIIFVTAAGKEQNYAFTGYETGAVDFLYKPLDVDAVRSKVSVFVDLYSQRMETRRQVEALEKSRKEQELLMQQLTAMQDELQAAVRTRDDFISMATHELRTPLNTLYLESQLRKMQLDRGRADIFDLPYLNAMVARDRRQIEAMMRLIDDMMDASRINSKQLSIRPVPTELSALLARVVGNLTHQAAAAGSTITLDAGQPVTALWDEFRIEQVVINLLTNALRYGEGKPVEVSLRLLPESACISVRDQGRGISAPDQLRIFEQFSRVASDDGTGGLGLGLFITRQLVQAHGGSISVASRQGEGSVFTVTLPLTPPGSPAA